MAKRWTRCLLVLLLVLTVPVKGMAAVLMLPCAQMRAAVQAEDAPTDALASGDCPHHAAERAAAGSPEAVQAEPAPGDETRVCSHCLPCGAPASPPAWALGWVVHGAPGLPAMLPAALPAGIVLRVPHEPPRR